MKKLSYKARVITGLFLYAFGAAVFVFFLKCGLHLVLVILFIIAAEQICAKSRPILITVLEAGKQWSLP